MDYQDTTTAPPTVRDGLGFSLPALLGLAALGVPRVILHDLHLITEGTLVNWLLAVAPVAIWIALAVYRKVPKPFLTVLVIGALFGVMLVLTHQLLWDTAFQGQPPSIGPDNSTLLPRLAAIVSGLTTGALIGAVGGLVATGLLALRRRP